MQFETSFVGDVACISIEGNLNALDLLFMVQSEKYKAVIACYDKVLIDYSQISGSTLTLDDAIGMTLLGKLELESRQDIHIALAVSENERAVMEKVTQSLFTVDDSKITITNTREQALLALN